MGKEFFIVATAVILSNITLLISACLHFNYSMQIGERESKMGEREGKMDERVFLL